MAHQNTHWYKVGKSYTSNPLFADPGEVERVGLHDCFTQQCEEAHSSSAQTYFAEAIHSAEVARLATSVQRSKKLRKK